MKKGIALLLLLCLALALALPAGADTYNAWLSVTTSQRISSRSGPGTQYDETGSYYQAGVQVYALTKAWDSRNSRWWVQIELTYAGKQRRVYTGEQRLYVDLADLPEEKQIGAGYTTAQANAYYGPGTQYGSMKDAVPSGRDCTVYHYEGGYVQVQLQVSSGKYRRAWIKESAFHWTWGPSYSSSGNSGNSSYTHYGSPFYMASANTYVKTYPLQSTKPYTSSSLTTVGTVIAPNSTLVIPASADVYILEAGDTWAKVTYPSGGGRTTAYVRLSDLTANNAQHEVRTASGRIYFAPQLNGPLNSEFFAGKGDVMVVVAQSGSRYQVIYPVSNGKYRMAWCEIADFYKNSY